MSEQDAPGSNVVQFGGQQPPPPVRFEIVPDQLFAIIDLHEMKLGEAPMSCWSYVSEGLIKFGQKELAILVKKESGETEHDYPMDPLGLFYTVREYAEKSNFVMPGDVTEFGDTGFIDPKFRAMAYLRPIGIGGLEDPNAVLSCVLLTAEELDVARRFGLTRVMALLGFNFSHFPCPPWVDRGRKSVIDTTVKNVMDASVLAKVPCFAIPGVRVQLAGGLLSIRCPHGIEDGLRELLKQIPEEAPLTISTEFDPDANALLVWQPTMENGPSAMTPPGSDGSRICGCSVLIFPEQDDSNAQVIEDSFLLSLKTPDWIKLRNGLMTGVEASLMTQQGGKIQVSWYEPEAGLVPSVETLTHLPRVENAESTAKITEASLLTEASSVVKSISPGVLKEYVEAVEYIILGYFTDRKATHKRTIKVVCELSPGGKRTWTMSSQPDEDKIELKGIEIRLNDLPVPVISENPVSFEVVADLTV